MKTEFNTKPLWEATRDLHHACEMHAVGGSMASGAPPRHWYAAWLEALHQIHSAIDQHLPEVVHRSEQLQSDILSMGIDITQSKAAAEYVKSLKNKDDIIGAGYVLTGAHLMGGEIMRRRLNGFPTNHLTWDDRKAALAVLQELRSHDNLTDAARACFTALLKIMDEIECT